MVQAQVPTVVNDPINTGVSWLKQITDKVWNALKWAYDKGGAKAFQVVLRSSLNKIAYDAANYVGSGDWGQTPLFVDQNLGEYFQDIGEEAAGEFVENFANNLNENPELKKAEGACNDTYSECTAACAAAGGTYSTNPLTGQTSAPSTERIKACKQSCYDDNKSCTAGVNKKYEAQGITPIAVCQPSSIDVKLKIALGLAAQNRPKAPNCTATGMVDAWKNSGQSIYDRMTQFKDPKFLDTISGIFDPTANDLGIYLTMQSDLTTQQAEKKFAEKAQLDTSGLWKEKRNPAGNLISIPDKAKMDVDASSQMYAQNFGTYTGDAFIDAANIFLNQAALTAYNKLLSGLGQKVKDEESPEDKNKNSGTTLSDANRDPSTYYSQGNVQEFTASIVKPVFTSASNYDVLSKLAVCSDQNNSGPLECVIDDRFMQGINEKQTVAEAIKKSYLQKTWLFSDDPKNGNSYNPRQVSILRKYRILPVGWEEAINKITSLKKKVTLGDLVSCFDPNDNYSDFSSSFDVQNQGWCQGLIDPNWVLKAPAAYCRKSGVGAQILDRQVIDGMAGQNGLPNTPSSISVTRADDYCADEQTCIKEKGDGTCEAYGYCNSEKRTWTFGDDGCDPIYNSCQTFAKTSGGSATSYLQNTLVYEGCNANNAGCKQFAVTGTYSDATQKVSWDAAKSVYLNKNALTCSTKNESCSSFLRVKPAWGANLVMNADFGRDALGDKSSACSGEMNDWQFKTGNGNCVTLANPNTVEIVDASLSDENTGAKALHLYSNNKKIGIYSDSSHSLIPDNFTFLPNQSYILSADVYLKSGDAVYLWIGPEGNISAANTASTSVKDSWQHLTFSKTSVDSINEPSFAIVSQSNSSNNDIEFYVKNIKFELSNYDTGFRVYGAYKIYEKILPAYLESACYVNSSSSGQKDYSFKPGAPAVCYNFARKCNKSEAGCELFSSLEDKNFSVPAQAAPADYCPQECLGYDSYISKATAFNIASSENIIPKKAQACSAEAAGCNEFTNLDASAQGGEQKEYYSALKHCIKPNNDICANFYVWEGGASGYQLKTLSLEKNPSTGSPVVTQDDSSLCNATVYNAPVGDPAHNPDCQQFYDTAGAVSYHLISRTVTCSDDCHKYRLTAKNIDKAAVAAADCQGASRHWDMPNATCYVCLNGGAWDDTHEACVYQAIPSEGTKCKAAENNCREYNGNNGNNLKIVSAYDFESGLNSWTDTCGGAATQSQESNAKNGHSLYFAPSGPSCQARATLGNSVSQGSAYVVRFIAKANTTSDVGLRLSFLNQDNEKVSFNTNDASAYSVILPGDSAWHVYQVNLAELNHVVQAAESLVLEANNNIFIDNIVIKEITDKYYLLANSSATPGICYYDMLDNFQGPDYNIGCSAYRDRDKVQHNLRGFSRLCQDSAVGCEMMIDTKNYSPYYPKAFNDDNGNGNCDSGEANCYKVPGDSIVYAVFDSKKLCNSADQGCARLGQASPFGSGLAFSDVYRLNNPDNYNQSLCSATGVGCEEWKDDSGGLSYFKDPGNNTCVYRKGSDSSGNKSWYKSVVKRCDLNSDKKIKTEEGYPEQAGAPCTKDSDCGASIKCINDTNDYACPTSYLKTIGYGGQNNLVPTPAQSAGICDANSSGCTEYIDPVSSFATNLIYNPNFIDVNGDGILGDGWLPVSGANHKQEVTIEPGKLYSFRFLDPAAGTANSIDAFQENLNCSSNFRVLQEDNNLSPVTENSMEVVPNTSYLLLSPVANVCTFNGGKLGRTFELKEAVISYQKKSNIDKTSCNGIVDFDNGCVLFNERSYGPGLTSLVGKWDANKSLDKQAPAACTTSAVSGTCVEPGGGVGGDCEPYQVTSCNANQLIKVRPDRTCGTWLDCISYTIDPKTKEKTCYAYGECDRLNDNKECANFTKVPTTARNFNFGNDKNTAGYSLLNAYHLANMKEVGSDTNVHYDFETKATPLVCRRANGSPTACLFDKNINEDSIITEPKKSPVDYPANGKGFLKVPTQYQISPMSTSACMPIVPNKDYYLNYLANTKGSNFQAKVTITDCFGTEIMSFSDAADSGWERKIHKLRFTSGSSFQIHFGANSKASGGEVADNSNSAVYFDDVNIEPVLQINNTGDSNKDYVAKECRLYPNVTSLTCLSQGNNVISDGLFGYCLDHDKKNTSICNMWYPSDSIGAGINRNNKTLGYKGIFPLNYCTEANGNFKIVEKREIKLVLTDGCEGYIGPWQQCYLNTNSGVNAHSISGGSEAAKEVGSAFLWECNLDNLRNTTTSVNVNGGQTATIQKYCGGQPGDYWMFTQGTGGDSPTNGYKAYFCVPTYFGEAWVAGHKSYLPKSLSKGLTINTESCSGSPSITVNYVSGWYEYNSLNSNKSIYQEINCGANYNECHEFDESKNSDPAVRIYDLDNPPAAESELKTFDNDNNFYLTCNKFVQTVDPNGYNMAWVNRVGKDSAFPYNTPDFFLDASNPQKFYRDSYYSLTGYGRNREAVPFGAATLPADFDIFGSSAIKFRDQYSKKNDESIFAGRPYGCSGPSCGNIGYCSKDPNVYCLLYTGNDNSYIANQSCSGGAYGTCLALWDKDHYLKISSIGADYKNILKTLFIKNYSSFDITESAAGNISYGFGVSQSYNFSISDLPPCVGSRSLTGFCAVYPKIENMKLWYNGGTLTPNASGAFTLPAVGIYRLEFNSIIDPEQQPLKEIYIDWGDGIQIVNNQDSHPYASDPHIFYHFYNSVSTLKTISITVYDNWDRYKSLRLNNTAASSPINLGSSEQYLFDIS